MSTSFFGKWLFTVTCLVFSISVQATTTETHDGVSKIEGTCDETTYLAICHGEDCEEGSSNATLKKGELMERHVLKQSQYCMSCEDTPNLETCDKDYIPLGRTID
ncbi:TPA: hypothetical protein N3C02_004225 [Vibrio parahaemolyticus]|nr:hypothetical protein [Vibrio parahaemolyticus]MDF4595123.1 hypothetical protein [Vibrio parahaemolyticus]HAS6793750.1 hypothetical protein [Vibrio parahaemolyticus]HCM2153082.1 hypothetical protein [Vibrio parahaemolyticus]